MSSDFHTEFASDAAPDLFDTFGAAITHRPLGVAASDVSVTGIVEELPPQAMDERGVGTRRRAMLQVEDSVSVNVRDRWIINSVAWETDSVEGDYGGMIRVSISRPVDEIRSGMKSPSMI